MGDHSGHQRGTPATDYDRRKLQGALIPSQKALEKLEGGRKTTRSAFASPARAIEESLRQIVENAESPGPIWTDA